MTTTRLFETAIIVFSFPFVLMAMFCGYTVKVSVENDIGQPIPIPIERDEP